MVEGQPSTNFWLIFALPFQQSEHHPSKLAGQYYQRLCGAIASRPLCLIKRFPCLCSASRHRCVMQQAPSF